MGRAMNGGMMGQAIGEHLYPEASPFLRGCRLVPLGAREQGPGGRRGLTGSANKQFVPTGQWRQAAQGTTDQVKGEDFRARDWPCLVGKQGRCL